MLTIKHRTGMGEETVYPAEEVHYIPLESTVPHPNPLLGDLTGVVMFSPKVREGEPLRELREGTVYVMNELGRTVAKYDIGGWVKPALAT